MHFKLCLALNHALIYGVVFLIFSFIHFHIEPYKNIHYNEPKEGYMFNGKLKKVST